MAWEGNLHNRLMERSKQPLPIVGMGATLCFYSDRHPCTIIDVLKPNLIILQRDRAIRTDNNGMSDSQSYRYECDSVGQIFLAKRSKSGWKAINPIQMQHLRFSNGTKVMVGHRSAYHDYSF